MTSDGALAAIGVSVGCAVAIAIATSNWAESEKAHAHTACVQNVKDKPAEEIKKICGEKK